MRDLLSKQRIGLLLTAFVLAFVLLFILAPESTPKEVQIDADASMQVLDDFFSANEKVLTVSVEAVSSSGATSNEVGEIWVKDQNLRRDFFDSQGLKRIQINSYDGDIYLCHTDKEGCTKSPLGLEGYIYHFVRPDVDAVDSGVDQESSCRIFTYPIKKSYDVIGADTPFYIEEISYCVNESQLVYLTTSSTVSADTTQLRSTTFRVNQITVGESIPDDTFDLPFPIVELAPE